MGIGRPRSCECGECSKCKHREYMRRWYLDKPGYAAAQGRKHRVRARDYERHRYHTDDDFRQKKNARNKVGVAIMSGLLVRLPCEVCGAAPAEAHHDDYSRPLDVRWLCRNHHAEHHNAEAA